MGLISNNTSFYFLSPDPDIAVLRHLKDVAFGCFVLIQKGVDPNNIHIFIDKYQPLDLSIAFASFGMSVPVNPIQQINCMQNTLNSESKSDVMVFVTGHGSDEGLQCSSPFRPYDFYKQFYSNPIIEKVVIFFGQCFAGVFNYMPLKTRLNLADSNNATIVSAGSTSFDFSVSLPVSVNNMAFWSGNIFLFGVFISIANSIDVDGDSCFTVMDAFKYAAVKTRMLISDKKRKDDLESFQGIQQAIEALKSKQLTSAEKDQLGLDIEAFKKILEIK